MAQFLVIKSICSLMLHGDVRWTRRPMLVLGALHVRYLERRLKLGGGSI